MSDGKWHEYQLRKEQLNRANLSPDEYEIEIKKLLDELGL